MFTEREGGMWGGAGERQIERETFVKSFIKTIIFFFNVRTLRPGGGGSCSEQMGGGIRAPHLQGQ